MIAAGSIEVILSALLNLDWGDSQLVDAVLRIVQHLNRSTLFTCPAGALLAFDRVAPECDFPSAPDKGASSEIISQMWSYLWQPVF